MTFRELLLLVKDVVVSPEVIIIGVLLILYLNLVFYVVSYRKPTLPSFKDKIAKNIKKTPEKPDESASSS